MNPSVRRPSSVPPSGSLQWYAVQVQSGREEAVKQALERRFRSEGLGESVGRVIIPLEKVVEVRNGRRVERTRKLFPGYLLCEVALDDQVLALVRETPGVIDFVRSGAAPVPLSPAEAARLVDGQSDERVNVLLPEFDPGDRVRILRGAFAQMAGEVAEVMPKTGQVRVRLTILDRPVLLAVDTSEVLHVGDK
jgi:transcriptional antiterminator NusG